jgi:pSer/pThr/pTyr-binding forkhead associated (FHA) protein
MGRTGATAGRDFVLMDVARIGAAPDNEIRVAAPGVSRRHARIVAEKGEYFLEDAGATNGTFLNGGRVQREALRHLDVITLGRAVELIFIRREGETPAPRRDQITDARVKLVDGPEAGTIVEVPKGELTFGRAPSCNVVLASGLISKVHARLQRTGNQLVLQDLQSVNGTFVNATRVDSIVVLKNGDVISFAGARSVSVAIEGAAASPAAAPPAVADEPAFNQEWKTRFVWAPDELALIEAERAEAMQLAALRAPGVTDAAADKKAAAAAKPPTPAAPKPPAVAAAKPPAAAAPKPPATGAPKPPDATAPKPQDAAKGGDTAAKAIAAPAKAAAAPMPPKPEAAASSKPPEPPEMDEPPPTVAVRTSEIGPGGVTAPLGVRAPRLRGIKLISAGPPISRGLGTFVVGRAAGSDVRLDDRQVSRSHARIVVDETSATIEDLQTVNGTLVNGKEIKAHQKLHAGDTVQFGASEFKVELITG